MAKSKLELAVETGQWNKGLREAQQALAKFTKDQGGLDKAVKSSSNKMAEFVRIMGNTKSTAATASGQMKEYRSMIERCQVVVAQLNGEDKKLAEDGLQKLIQRFREAKSQAEGFSQELTGVKKSAKSTNGGLTEFANGIGINIGSLTKMGVAIGAAKMALDGLKATVSNNIETAMNFEYSMSKLQSLTGMAGDDLNTLKRKAIELGSSTTQSASQVADAFAIIGSKRPDLLSSAYALSDVTEAAIKMSEAAGMEVPEAADALAAALNIFQLQSDQATRVINVLAAGSKLGAAGIQELGDMTFRAGGSAKKAGLSFEEFAAAAEIIRPAFGSAEDAGQALSKFLSKLEEKMDNNYKPSVVGFQKAMENLKNANLGSNESLKIFTVNGVKAYDAIMANVDGLEKMTKGVTGTNTAYEQAAVNTDNLRGSMANLSSAWEGFNLAMNDSNGILKSMVDWLTQTVTWATNTFTELGRIKRKMDEINEAAGGRGKSRVDREMSALRGSKNISGAQRGIGHQYDVEIEGYQKQINQMQQDIDAATKNGGGQAVADMRNQIKDWQENIKALQNLKNEFYSRSNAFINGIPATSENTENPLGGNFTGTSFTKAEKDIKTSALNFKQWAAEVDLPFSASLWWSVNGSSASTKDVSAAVKQLKDKFSEATSGEERLALQGQINFLEMKLDQMNHPADWKIDENGISIPAKMTFDQKGLTESANKFNKMLNSENGGKKKSDITVLGATQKLLGGLQSITGGLEDLGVEFGDGFKKTIRVINGVMSILTGISTIVGVIQMIQAAMLARQMIPFFANGGFIHAANGIITGSHFSGDMQPLMVNAGEGVINQTDQAALFRAIKEGNFGGGGSIQSVGVRGTDLLLCLNNELRSQGKQTL